MGDIRAETNYHARKFYAQRNLYLTGATLILAIFLARAFSITFDLVKVQEELNVLGNSTAKNTASTKQSEQLDTEIATLRKRIQAKDAEIGAIKKQAAQNETAFDGLNGGSAGVKKIN